MTFGDLKTRRWTREDYYRLAEGGAFEGRRVELIRGEIVELSPQNPLHATAVCLTASSLRRTFSRRFVVREEKPLALGLHSDPEPDIAVVRGCERDFLTAHPGTAVLAVEVADSSLEADRSQKASIYAEAGIPEFWLVNLVDRQLEVYRDPVRDSKLPHGFGYRQRTSHGPADSVSPLAAPDASVRVADLLP